MFWPRPRSRGVQTARASFVFSNSRVSAHWSQLAQSIAKSNQPDYIDLQEDVRGRRWRQTISKIVYNPGFEVLIGAILMFNLSAMVIDTDLRALDQSTPMWISVSGDVCSAIYLIEFISRLFVERKKLLRSSWNRLDLVVVSLGVVEKLVSLMTALNPTSMMLIRIVRIFRVLRLVRAIKLMTALRELRKLIQMMMMCVRTLFWSFVLTFLLMTMWSIILVEFVHPIVQDIEAATALWAGELEWTQSYCSVMRANLTLFQTIVAGDSWGTVPIPVIQEQPWTAMLFLPAQVTLVFGVLNLIVAVVVDTFAEVRANDQAHRLQEMELEEQSEKASLNKIFQSIDADNSGSVTFDELQKGAEENVEFRQKLRVMDVSKADLSQLFTILDEDGSGDVDPEEFIETLYRLKCADSRTATVLVKHYVTELGKRQDKIEERLKDNLAAIGRQQGRPDRMATPTSESMNRWGTPKAACRLATSTSEGGVTRSKAAQRDLEGVWEALHPEMTPSPQHLQAAPPVSPIVEDSDETRVILLSRQTSPAEAGTTKLLVVKTPSETQLLFSRPGGSRVGSRQTTPVPKADAATTLWTREVTPVGKDLSDAGTTIWTREVSSSNPLPPPSSHSTASPLRCPEVLNKMDLSTEQWLEDDAPSMPAGSKAPVTFAVTVPCELSPRSTDFGRIPPSFEHPLPFQEDFQWPSTPAAAHVELRTVAL